MQLPQGSVVAIPQVDHLHARQSPQKQVRDMVLVLVLVEAGKGDGGVVLVY